MSRPNRAVSRALAGLRAGHAALDDALEDLPRCTASGIPGELEPSLRRVDVEYIDLYQVHWPPEDGTPVEDYRQTMVELKNAGQARAVGLSNHGVAQLERPVWECHRPERVRYSGSSSMTSRWPG